MLTKYNRATHGDITYNKEYRFLQTETGILATDNYADIADVITERLTGCRRHHTALRRSYEMGGYVPVAETRLLSYRGRFGEGYMEIRNYSSQYVAVTYWIRES